MEKHSVYSLFDPQQIFPVPFSLIANTKKILTSQKSLRQPFAYEVYCPIACKKVKIGVASTENKKETMEFNSTTSRWVSVYVDKDIKYLVNDHIPVKKDKKKAPNDLPWNIYVEVQQKGNIAIFNPFYIDPSKPLSLYTFENITKAFKPSADFSFSDVQPSASKFRQLTLGSRKFYLKQSDAGCMIAANTDFDDLQDGKITLHNPHESQQTLRGSPQQLKKTLNEHITYWLWQLNQHHILQKTGKAKQIDINLDLLYERLNFYLNLDQQLRIKLLSTYNKELAEKLYAYHPRTYSAMNRLVSFINYGDTRFNVFKLAELGFFNKTDMLQDLAYIESPFTPVPSAQEGKYQNQIQFRSRTFPYARMNRCLPYPNVGLDTCLKAITPQTVTEGEILMSEISDPYVLFVDKEKRLSLWSGRITPLKLFEVNFSRQLEERSHHKVLTVQSEQEIQQSLKDAACNPGIFALGDIFENQEAEKKQPETEVKEVAPDQMMLQQLLNMGYKLDIVKKALLRVKNQSIPVALDEIEKLMGEEKQENKPKVKPKKEWNCKQCTFLNPPQTTACAICLNEGEFIDQEELERQRKQQEENSRKFQQLKEEQQRLQAQKKAQEERKRQEQLQKQKIKQAKLQFYKNSHLLYAKVFRTESSLNPFIVVALQIDQNTKKSLIRVVRIGYSRAFLTYFYRFQNDYFVSNYNRKLCKKNGNSTAPIEEILKESWLNIEVISRLTHSYNPEEYIVLQSEQIFSEEKVSQLQSDGKFLSYRDSLGLHSFKIVCTDTLQKSTFSLLKEEKQILISQDTTDIFPLISFQTQNSEQTLLKDVQEGMVSLRLPQDCSQVFIEAVEHFPAQKYQAVKKAENKLLVDSRIEGEIVMSEFLPLMVEHYEGSVFSSKYHSSSLLERENLYISNYPQACFTFRHIDGRPMLIDTVTVISANKRLQKIFPISAGLVFTGDELSWFQLGKERFTNFKRQDYEQWLNTKHDKNDYRDFWEPVGFFEIEQNQVQIQLDYKRPAKYVFLLPTAVRSFSQKLEVAAIKIDFFGVKGKLQEDTEESDPILNFKHDSESKICTYFAQGNLVKTRSSLNSMHFLPAVDTCFKQIPVSVSTFFSVKLRKEQKQFQLKSPYLWQVRYKCLRRSEQSKALEEKLNLNSYKQLVENLGKLTQQQLLQALKQLPPRQLLLQLLNHQKSFRNIEKVLKKLMELEQEKHNLFRALLELLPELCEEEIPVNEHGLRTFLRLFQKLYPLNTPLAFKALCKAWENVTSYIENHRNKNYTVLRHKYQIQELILEPYLFSKDYYRLIHPDYTEEETPVAICQEPKTPLNSVLYVQKENDWVFRTLIDLGSTKQLESMEVYFPRLTQTTNKFKVCFKVFSLSDQGEQLLYYRYFHEEFLVQFAHQAHKERSIYSHSRNKINHFTIELQGQSRFLRFEYSYLLLTTHNHLRYKQPTEQVNLFPLVRAKTPKMPVEKTYCDIEKLLGKFPQEAKHNSVSESLPPLKYTIDQTFSRYEIYQFPSLSGQHVSQEFNSMIDRLTTNIMDPVIVEECKKNALISQYQLGHKGVDFGYWLMVGLLKMFKKMPADYTVPIPLLLAFFRTFVVYEIGPIMLKAMAFIGEVYRRLPTTKRCSFVSQVLADYLSNFRTYSELKQNEKYPLQKVLEKINELELPLGLLVERLSYAYTHNNRFMVGMLLRLIRPNMEKHGLTESSLVGSPESPITLRGLLQVIFGFNLWALKNGGNIKNQLLEEGLSLLLILLQENSSVVGKEKGTEIGQFINELEQDKIWELVFLTLSLKEEGLDKKVHEIFQTLMTHTTQQFQKAINQMLLQVIKKDPHSVYARINGPVNDDLRMSHLQTLLQYLNVGQKSVQPAEGSAPSFFLDTQTAIQLLNLPLTPVLWSLALLIIPRNDAILNTIIKNFKREYYASLGKQISKFCQPLVGIRALESIHIDWLELVRKIRVEGQSIFSLFCQQLKLISFGGREGVCMATTEEVAQLQITAEFLRLVLEKPLPKKQLTESLLRQIFNWFFLNFTQQKGISPATDLVKEISDNILPLLRRIVQFTQVVPLCIRLVLEIKRESQKMEGMFQQKRLPAHSALSLNKRFCKCFEEMLGILVTSDEMSDYLAFKVGGLEYIIEKLQLSNPSLSSLSQKQRVQSQPVSSEEAFLLSQKILSKREENKEGAPQLKTVEDLKEEEFANNVKVTPNQNATTSNVDWTVYKKGNKTKIIFLNMTDPNFYHEFPLVVELAKIVEVRSIKLGFPCASYEYGDKVVLSPSSVVLEGSLDNKSFEPLGQMTPLEDNGYLCNGVKVFILNFQKLPKINSVNQALRSIEVHRFKYLKIVVRRPLVTFVEGQFSQLGTKSYKNVGVSISFLSVMGNEANKLSPQLVNTCKQLSKVTSLNFLASLMTELNCETMKKIANQPVFATKVKENFEQFRDLMYKYPKIVPQIIFSLGSNNIELGDWLIKEFIKSGKSEVEALLVNQIIVSSPKQIFPRIKYFVKELLGKMACIRQQGEVQSSLLFKKYVPFMESLCQTLEQSYDTGFGGSEEKMVLDCDQQSINQLIEIYDKKHSSPEIKALIKMLISLVWLKRPLCLTEQVLHKTLDTVWKNCSSGKPHFYNIMSALLVPKLSKSWIECKEHQKTQSLLKQIQHSLEKNNLRALHSQIFLLSVVSYHEADFLRNSGYHLHIYNALKKKTFESQEIYQFLIKILQNIVLGYPVQQERLAKVLIEDVGLLVKKKDPILQKLFVGVLAMEKETFLNFKGIDLSHQEIKKIEPVPSRLLPKAQQKLLGEKIHKKCKYHTLAHSLGKQDTTPVETLYDRLSGANQMLVLISFKYSSKTYIYGAYITSSPKMNEEDWGYAAKNCAYQKGCFTFFYTQDGKSHEYHQETAGKKFISVTTNEEEGQTLLEIYEDEKTILHLQYNQEQEVYLTVLLGKHLAKAEASFKAIEIIECKPIGKNTWENKASQLLTPTNQAKAPFSWYRHSPIYVFPAQIPVKKMERLLSANVKIDAFKKVGSNEDLEEIGSPTKNGALILKEIPTSDFIIDVSLDNPQDYSGEEEMGYIPKMNIFEAFSRMNGIRQVLELGSASIKEWRNEKRKKSFEHYMEELKSFIHLPNFFSLFIKNHQYVTFLFEVASGLPDDPNSTRNWEEEEINSSRFIYKILADIFKFDRSKNIRDMDKFEDFCEVILDRLSQISKEAPRVFTEEAVKQEEEILEVANKLEKKKTEELKRRKKKGIGYGADNQNNTKWSASEWLQIKKQRSQEVLRVVSIIVSFLDCEEALNDERLSHVIKSSCLLPLVESALRSGSLLDISKESELFKSYLGLVKNLAKNPATVNCLVEIEKNYKPEQTESIHGLLGKLNNIADIFLECLKSGKTQTQSQNEVAEEIAVQIEKSYMLVDRAVRNLQKNKNTLTIKQINQLPLAQAYRVLLGDLRFGYVDMKKGGSYSHALHSNIGSSSPSTQKILRLSQELADLSSSLPCQHTNSIFVRCDKSRIDVIRILIMGSKDTPYSNGAFLFDLYCGDTYPNDPPKMVITTTGQGKIRFNPNLYSCGKVCLSLLGTWRGSASENWDAKVSTLLQLFISTQGITMSEDVYFNQPGFEGQQGSQEGEKKNEAYSNIVRLGNVRYAMVDQLKNPPKGFEEVIRRHFYIKKKEIMEECNKWLQYAEKRPASYSGLVSDHNNSWCAELKATKTKYKELLQKEVATLKELLDNLPEPDLKRSQQQEAVMVGRSQKKKRKVKEAELEIDVQYEKGKKEQLSIEEGVMQDRWSRYIGAMGIDAVKKQSSSNVLLVGLKYLGLEVAKNLVLSGLKKLTIIEDDSLEEGAAEQHFYMSDLKGQKISECIFKIKQLNPYMTVEHKSALPSSLKEYNLVVSTRSMSESLKISQLCRKENVKFIYSESCGVAGAYFADFGNDFTVNDPNGEEPYQAMIEKITCEKEGVVKLLEGVKHPYQDGDYVVFNRVQGMQMIKEKMEQISEAQIFYNKMTANQPKQSKKDINGQVFKVKVINWNSFSIGDTTKFSPYIGNGIVKNIKLPIKSQFSPFEEGIKDFDKFLDPNMDIYDFQKMGDNFSVFVCFRALGEFVAKHKLRIRNWQPKDCEEFVSIVENISRKDYKKNEQDLKNILQFAKKFAPLAEAELPAIGAYLGGLVAQEVIKGLTNKYTPIKQFFTFHLNEMAQKVPENLKDWQQCAVKFNEPFRNIKIVLGRQNAQKIEKMNLFIVGAGAIGCQLLKNFAMLNMGAQGKITVTDPDHIETSNLTRQFLFRQKHVKKPKSATAAAVLMQMNQNLKNHISARLDKVCQETEDIYSDEFFKNQTVIANALDNVKARQYMDKRCVFNKLPLFESGTLGPKGHVQVILPYKTENYGSQNDPNEEAQIPHCTLKMFPQEVTHCIEWSRDIFGKAFNLNPKVLKKVIETKDVQSLQGKQKSTVAKMVKYRPKKFEDCIQEAVRIFFKYFRNDIRQLLYTYPLDMKTKEGKLFWSLPKRPPKQISELDPKDEMHQTFIASYAVLFAKVFSISYPKDFRKPEGKEKIMETALKVKVQNFIPSAEKSKQIQEMTEKEEQNNELQESEKMQELQPENQLQQAQEVLELNEEEIKLTPQVESLKICPEEFEKDEDNNGHIDLIYSMSNLRARNYDLGECKWIDAKLKAGRIMAALSTTTSVVAALQTIQIIKLVSGCQIWRNAFVNLAIPLVQITEPGPAVREKIGNTEFSVWQDWEFKATNLKDLLNQMRQKFDVEGFNISTEQGTPIFWEAMYKGKQEAAETLLTKKLSSVIGKQKTVLNILMRDPQGEKIYEHVPKVIVEPAE